MGRREYAKKERCGCACSGLKFWLKRMRRSFREAAKTLDCIGKRHRRNEK